MMQYHEEYVDVPGGQLWTARQGRGPALICCHGGPGLWDYLAPVAAMVDDLATVYRYDQRDCGLSSGGLPYDLATALADLEALRKHWNVERWIVLGHSWGATLALMYALQYPERVQSIVYMAGVGIDPAWNAAYHANEERLVSEQDKQRINALRTQLDHVTGAEYDRIEREYCRLTWSYDLADRDLAQSVLPLMFREGVHINYKVNRELWHNARGIVESEETRKQVESLQVPALIMHGEADPRPVRFAQGLSRILPHAQFIALSNVGHDIWLEAPEQVREALRAFLYDSGAL